MCGPIGREGRGETGRPNRKLCVVAGRKAAARSGRHLESRYGASFGVLLWE